MCEQTNITLISYADSFLVWISIFLSHSGLNVVVTQLLIRLEQGPSLNKVKIAFAVFMLVCNWPDLLKVVPTEMHGMCTYTYYGITFITYRIFMSKLNLSFISTKKKYRYLGSFSGCPIFNKVYTKYISIFIKFYHDICYLFL